MTFAKAREVLASYGLYWVREELVSANAPDVYIISLQMHRAYQIMVWEYLDGVY
jgi:hypothetical protein